MSIIIFKRPCHRLSSFMSQFRCLLNSLHFIDPGLLKNQNEHHLVCLESTRDLFLKKIELYGDEPRKGKPQISTKTKQIDSWVMSSSPANSAIPAWRYSSTISFHFPCSQRFVDQTQVIRLVPHNGKINIIKIAGMPKEHICHIWTQIFRRENAASALGGISWRNTYSNDHIQRRVSSGIVIELFWQIILKKKTISHRPTRYILSR